MKNKRTKSIKLAITSILILSITLVASSQLFAQAAGYMTGIESLVIKKNDSNKKYTILEIVPSHEDGQLGYLVAGQEPVLLTDRLEEWIQTATNEEYPNTKENRIAYIKETLQQLQGKGLCGTSEAEQKPIIYQEYQETYFLSKDEDFKDWSKVTFSKDQLEKTQLEGHYVASDNGAYSKNIAGFEYAAEDVENSGYVVIFAPLTDATSEEEKALGIYRARDGADAGYQLATKEEIEEGTVPLFYISEYEYLPEEESSVYKPLLDTERPYEYVGKDGDCEFVPVKGEEAVYVEIGSIYYQGGFINQEWIKNSVLKTANSDEQQLQVQVLEKTVEELQSMEINDFLSVDFVHISGTNAAAYQQTTSNLSWEKVVQLFTQIAGERKIPCMINANLLEGMNTEQSKKSAINKLLVLCMQSNMDSVYETIKANATKEPDWNTLNTSVKNSNGYEWVQNNIYAYRTDLIKNWKQSFTDSQIKAGYEEINLFIEKENLYRGSKDKLEETITPVVCIQYIINFAHTKEIQSKTKIKVLELQPCKSYSLTAETVLGWNGTNKGLTKDQITIDQMTTSEFIGKINDLNTEYDLIYMGLNTGAMNTVNGSTVFNDESMNGLVYMHTGDAVISSAQLAGLMDHDYVKSNRKKYINAEKYNGRAVYAIRRIVKNGKISTFKDATTFPEYMDVFLKNTYSETFTSNVGVYRYSGNDITKEKMDELLDYVAANYPVVLADDFYTDKTWASINTKKIDNSSYVYDFLQETKDCNNVLPVSKISNSSLFSYYINMPKLEIDFMTSTGGIISEDSDNYNENVLTTTKENGRYYINLYFRINNEMNTSAYTKYIPAFYIDLNADGKFSTKTELFSANDAKVMDENGKIVSNRDEKGNYLLQAGKQYHLKKELPSSYQSIMTWKLEVQQQSNSYVRTSKVCYTPIQNVGSVSETVKVLQIRVDDKYDGGSLANTWDLAKDQTFKNLLKDKETTTGLTFVLTSQQASDYTKSFHAAANQGRNYLDDYDMLIIGFADAYAEIEDGDAVQGILDFIKSGKSILFTHDTTSFVNVEKSIYRKQSTTYKDYTTSQLWNGNYYWGYNINKYLREIVGMDRYGIMDETSADGVNDVLQKAEIIDLTNTTILNGLNASKDKAYAAGSSKKYAYGETQGYTNHLLDQQRLGDEFTKYRNLKNVAYNSITDRNVPVQVTQVNEGQITTYPYEIPETFTASSTHYQYFQLDLERDADNDGESDIVVWYCLGQRSGANPYAQSPNDVRNAYYIYSIGNVMYSGVGHSTVTKQNGEDWERKLFVNTIVAAYKTGVKSPTVSILEDQYVNAQEKEYEYLTFDESILAESGQAIDKEITVHYSIADSNLVTSDKTISANYYIGDSTTPITLKTYTAAGKDVSTTQLESGEVYSVTIPVKELTPYLAGKDSVTIRIEANSKFNYYGKDTSLTAENQLTVVKTVLQELN